jgi:hypothetical protein
MRAAASSLIVLTLTEMRWWWRRRRERRRSPVWRASKRGAEPPERASQRHSQRSPLRRSRSPVPRIAEAFTPQGPGSQGRTLKRSRRGSSRRIDLGNKA